MESAPRVRSATRAEPKCGEDKAVGNKALQNEPVTLSTSGAGAEQAR